MGKVDRVFAVAAIGSGLVLLAACGWGSRNTVSDDTAVEQSFNAVRIANDSGSVKISTGPRASVHRTIHYDKTRPGATHHVEGSTLVVDSCRERNCSIDYELTVPTGTRVDGKLDSGSLEVEGVAAVNLKIDSGSATVRRVTGKVNLDSSSGGVDVSDVGDTVVVRSESGQVRIADVRAAVTVQAESGGIEVRSIDGAADLESQSGSVNVSLANPNNVRVQADSGSVTVAVPHADYKVRAVADSGNVHNSIGDQPSGAHQLDLRTDSGNITVSYA